MTAEDRIAKNNSIKEAMKLTHEKRKSQTCRVFKCKIQNNNLSAKQREQLKMMFVEAKWIWNEIIRRSDSNIVGENNVIKPWEYKPGKTVQVLNQEGLLEERELKYIQSQMKQCVQSQLCSNIKTLATLKKKGMKVGRIRFQKECKKLHIKQMQNFHIKNGSYVKLPNVHGKIRLNGLNQFKKEFELGVLEIACADILNTPQGYFVSFTTYTDNKWLKKTKTKKKKIVKTIGIDFGCETSFTTSEGEKIDAKVAETDRLKRLQKQIAKKQGSKKGEKKSNSYLRKLDQIHKEYQKISNRKDNLANQIVAKFSQYETIVIQDEQLSKWQKSGHGKAIQHSVLGRVKSKLKTMDNVVILAKNAPTTKLCSKCGVFHDEMRVWHRTFKCDCGVTMDRDIHAAKNMVWMYENNVGVERTKLTRLEMEALVLSMLDHSGNKMPRQNQLPSRKAEDSTL